MDVREYLAIRRAYNLVRQKSDSEERLTFAEFAILCHLTVAGGTLRTSDIVAYQNTLRPTMTHRTKHLTNLDLIWREKGSTDRRSVICRLTTKGSTLVEQACTQVCQQLVGGSVLGRTTPARVLNYVDAMGALPFMASELVILGIASQGDRGVTISELVSMLGLLQPTISMSVSSLTKQGIVRRGSADGSNKRVQSVLLTEEGQHEYEGLRSQIGEIVVHRQSRS